MNWSEEVYRLDQVAYKCQLPCVVKVLEGILMDTEAETVSAGDIIKLDKHTRIPKVVANFVQTSTDQSDQWHVINKNEIFVPLNYHGKVKIINEIKNYSSIKDLVQDFPRFAVVKRTMTVEKETKETVTIQLGATIELDRVIPGCKRGNHRAPDKLVIKFERNGENMVFGLPCDMPGQFQSLPDEGEYTIKEVVERYPLPQIVNFLESDLRKVYMESLVDVVENVRTITDTLQLNRYVSQEVLIGHYKPLEEMDEAESEIVTRTLVVLPLEAEFVREIEVNVLLDATEDDYEKLCLVTKPSRAVEAVQEMIYVDFAKSPGIVRLDEDAYDYVYAPRHIAPAPPPERPPPRPRKPNPTPNPTQASSGTDAPRHMASAPLPERPPPRPSKPNPTQASSGTGSLGIKKKPSFLSKVKGKLYVTNKEAKQSLTSPPVQSPTTPPVLSLSTPPLMSPTKTDDDNDDDQDPYEDINETLMDKQIIAKHTPARRGNEYGSYGGGNKSKVIISPHATRSKSSRETQEFRVLTINQLYERLKKCGMQNLAEVCKKENLDGDFMSKVDIQSFKGAPFNLTDFELEKLGHIKQNWIPS